MVIPFFQVGRSPFAFYTGNLKKYYHALLDERGDCGALQTV